MDIKRICEDPTDEDRQWFPDLINKDWLTELNFAMKNFNDGTFISQYLSPHLIRDMKLFSVLDDEKKNTLEVEYIHNEAGYAQIRKYLSDQFSLP